MVEISREAGEIISADQYTDDQRQQLWQAFIRDVVRNRRIDLPCYGTPEAERA